MVPWYRSDEYYAKGWQGSKALDGGGALINQSIHYIDLLVWMLGEAAEVCGFADHVAHDIEVEDLGTAAVRFVSGAHGVVQGATCTYQGLPGRLEIYGSRGSIIVAGEDLALWQVEGEEDYFDAMAGLHKGGASEPRGGMDEKAVEAHAKQLTDLVRAIESGRTPDLDGREARKAVELILAIYESAEKGEVVKLR
jgi:predicted dehydrogenase